MGRATRKRKIGSGIRRSPPSEIAQRLRSTTLARNDYGPAPHVLRRRTSRGECGQVHASVPSWAELARGHALKFGVLAIDYDGTVAEHGRLDGGVRAAIEEVRDRGIAVVLVTGRILEHLRGVAGDLSFADAVVAENGAVLSLQGDLLAPPRPGGVPGADARAPGRRHPLPERAVHHRGVG